MEFCRKDGYCLSLDMDSSKRLIFTYYDLGITIDKTLYVSSRNKYEESIILDKVNKEKLFFTLAKHHNYSDSLMIEYITRNFDQVSGLNEIKSFLNEHDIAFEPYTWVEFYD